MAEEDTVELFLQTFAQEEREQRAYLDLGLAKMSTRSLLMQMRQVEAFHRWMREHVARRWQRNVPGQDMLEGNVL